MHHPTHLENKDVIADDSVFKTPHIALFGEKHWSYLQKHYHMSPRELQVARLVCEGFRNGEISKKLKIRHGTVKTHLRNIYRRVRIKSKIEMVLKFVDDTARYSARSGITPPFPIMETQKSIEGHSATSKTAQSQRA